MRVNVTKRDIDRGSHSPMYCPIALAAFRAFGFPCYVSNGWMWIYRMPYPPCASYAILLPKIAQEFERKFDTNRRSVEPISFEVGE